MTFGNFFRLFNLPIFRDNILVSEVLLYFFAFSYLLTKKINKGVFQILILAGIILVSSIYGSLLHEKDLRAILFGMRLIGTLFASYALGDMFWKKYGYDIQKFLRFFLFPFVLWIVFGFIIYFTFPSLANFWLILKEHNIVFNGDPHIGRFVTVLFDPNIYGSIVFLPILVSFMLYNISQKNKYLLLTNAFMITAVLTWSRSGIATVCILLMVVVVRAVLNKRTFFLNKIFLLNVLIFGHFLFLLPVLCYSEFHFFISRLFNVVDDGSALSRLRSFETGLSILQDYPLFGIGYNYLPSFLDGLNFLDSSILGLMVCFGIGPFSILAFIAAIRFFSLKNQINRLKSLNPFLYEFCSIFLCYILVTIFFSSNFNNVLFFPFWIIPSLSCLIYIGKMTQHQINYNTIKE
jgi:O-antigen ligase